MTSTTTPHRLFTLFLVALLLLAACDVTPPASPTSPTRGETALPAQTLACPASVTLPSPTGGAVVVTYPLPRLPATGAVVEKAVCAPSSGSVFPLGRTMVTCSVTEGDAIFGSCSFNVLVIRIPAPQLSVTRFLAFGDSITEGFLPSSVAEVGTSGVVSLDISPFAYPSRLQTMLGDRYWEQSIAVINSGVGGETAERGLQRLPGVLDETRPEVLLLLHGVNGLRQVATLTVANTLRTMVQTAQARGVQVMIATVTPIGPLREYERPGEQAKIVELNSMIVRLAAETGIGPVVDLYGAFGNDISLLSSDHFHPNNAGYRLMADTFFQAIVAKFDQR